jgi:hypothetical protein
VEVPGVLMEQNVKHLINSDVHITRQWTTFYTRRQVAIQCIVSITAEFDDDEAALEFERKVREILRSD